MTSLSRFMMREGKWFEKKEAEGTSMSSREVFACQCKTHFLMSRAAPFFVPFDGCSNSTLLHYCRNVITVTSHCQETNLLTALCLSPTGCTVNPVALSDEILKMPAECDLPQVLGTRSAATSNALFAGKVYCPIEMRISYSENVQLGD
jgi:hypothetical protein